METRDDKQGVAFNGEKQCIRKPPQKSAARVPQHDWELSWIGTHAFGEGVNRFAETRA